jgi:SAM-dependent methyltransferase
MHPKKIVKKGYDEVGGKYTATRDEELAEMKLFTKFSDRIPSGGRVLDLGCGAGVPFTKNLSEKFDVTGVDLSPKQIERARKNAPRARFICEDMSKIHSPENHYDGIYAYYSIIHVPRNEHFTIFLNMYKMLKLGGVILVSLHSSDDPESIYDDYFGTKMYWSGFDKDENIKLIKNAGFKIIWTKLVQDSLGDSKHLFVLAQKPI